MRSLTVIGVAFLVGCGSGHPPTYPVSGKVVFADGTPLTTGGVVLSKSFAEGGKAFDARGAIRADGTFTLTTFEEGDGAVAGKHRVLVRAKRDTADFTERGMLPRPVIDPRFERFETSGLAFTVETNGKNDWTLPVAPPMRGGAMR